MKFTGILEKYEDNLWNYHIKVPKEIKRQLDDSQQKRFLCQLNEGNSFHASLMPAGNNIYFIKINQELRGLHKLELGDHIDVTITKDESPYGMPLPVQLQELFQVDPEGDKYFHQLTPGKQRSLLFLIGKIKSSDKRIYKSVVILEHLKEQKGQLDFKILNEDFKNKKDHFQN